MNKQLHQVQAKIYIFIALSLLGVICIDNYKFILILFFCTIVFFIHQVNYKIAHPFTWFLPFYFFYYSSGAILMWQGQINFDSEIELLLKWSYISLLPFLLILNVKTNKYELFGYKYLNTSFFKILWVITTVISFISIITIFLSGSTSKREINLNQEHIFQSSISFSLMIMLFSIIIILNVLNKKEFPLKFILLNIIIITMFFLVNGERDLVLRVLIISIVVYLTLYRNINKFYLLSLGGLSLLLLPIMQNFKNFAVKGQTNNTITGNLITDVFSSEFISASSNLKYLYEAKMPYLNGETLIWDIKRVLGIEGAFSPTQWFNETFFPKTVAIGGGRGFSFLGEGYLNFGFLGMVLWMIILSLILKFLYILSTKNIIMFCTYVISIPTIIYILRADFSNLFSGILKQVLIPLIFIFICQWIYKHLFSGNLEKANN